MGQETRVLIVTPLPVEREALLSAGLRLPVEVGAHGKVAYALAVQRLIGLHRPSLVVCAGACGALSESLRALDVVVATETIEHDFKLRFAKRPLPRFPAEPEALARLRAAGTGLRNSEGTIADFKLHYGRIASGDEDVVDRTRAAEIHAATEALAVAWEGAGGARACAASGVGFLEIRAVTDAAGANAPQEFARQLPEAMARLAAVLNRL